MSWQTQLYTRLRDREWHQIGELFEAVEAAIPLHTAMRHMMHPNRGRSELPTNDTARWRLFLSTLATIGVDSDGGRKRLWTDRVQLKYVAGKSCEACGGQVIKAGWSSHDHVVCLACEVPPVTVPVPPPVYRVPKAETLTLRPSIGWGYRCRRAFAEFLKNARLPFLSASQILKQWEKERVRNINNMNIDLFLLRRGKEPIPEHEIHRWMQDYMREHPP